MKPGTRILALLLAAGLTLGVCAALGSAAGDAAEPSAAAAASSEAEAEEEASGQAAEPTPLTAQATFPDGDEATGTLIFYIGDAEIYAGGPVADLLAEDVQTYADTSAQIAPGHISGNIRFRIESGDTEDSESAYLFITAINPSEETRPLSECLIYSITVNCSSGISFGSGNEATPFVSMVSTYDEIIAAYGEPDDTAYSNKTYKEAAYYEPFSCAYFCFKQDVVRQIMTYYCPYLYPALAEDPGIETDGYFGSDAYILMNQYMDVTPYLSEDEQASESYAPSLDTYILMNDERVDFGKKVSDMPETFSAPFEDLVQYISTNYYIRTGKGNEEEFYLMNYGGMSGSLAKNGTVKGVITQNPAYTNWGSDLSGFHTFEYQGLRSDGTIEDVLEIFGQPQELHATSSAKACFVWMHYTDESGNTLRVCVDPMLDEIIELRAAMYIEGERHY